MYEKMSSAGEQSKVSEFNSMCFIFSSLLAASITATAVALKEGRPELFVIPEMDSLAHFYHQ